jgi:hypothetical protein
VRFSAGAPVVDPGPAVVSYASSFGDGATAAGSAVSHRFTKPGRYLVSLTVTDALGGTSVAETVVRAQALHLALTPTVVVFGNRVVVHGALVPGERGASVLLERRAGASWRVVKRHVTDALARYHLSVRPGRSADWRARIGELRSAPTLLTVAPQLHIETRPGTAFLGAPVIVHAQPLAKLGVRVTVLHGGREVATARGVLERPFTVPAPGTGRFLARIEVAGRVVTVSLRAGARTLSVGSNGPDVPVLRTRLAQLHVRVPGPSTMFGSELFDSVVAFQKARGLERTGTVDAATWRTLSQGVVPRPRYRGPGAHLEVSKRRRRRRHGSARRSSTGR